MFLLYHVFTPPPIDERSTVMSLSVYVFVCVCVCACSRSYLWITRPIFTKFFVHVTCGCGSILLWWCSDTLRISGFVDYVIFAHLLIACSMSPAGWGSEAHTYAALGLLHKNTRCRQQMLRINFCSQCLIGHSGCVEYLWHHACTKCPCILSLTRKWHVF